MIFAFRLVSEGENEGEILDFPWETWYDSNINMRGKRDGKSHKNDSFLCSDPNL